MIDIVKKRSNIENLVKFLSRYQIDGTVYVPMLHDGVIESCLSENNKLLCKPSDKNFQTLWDVLQTKAQVLSRFIEVYQPEEETPLTLSETLKIQTNDISKAYNLLSLCRRASDNVLMGGTLSEREATFDKEYLGRLKEYRPNFEIVSREATGHFIFQDLTYLRDDEVKDLPIQNKYLLVTDNKHHLYYFDGANYSSLDEYYLIWR